MCQRHLVDGTGQLEVARVSRIHHQGVVLSPDSWLMCDAAGTLELVYIQAMFQISAPSCGTGAVIQYLHLFRFSFQQLKLRQDVNTLRVNKAYFQALLDAAPVAITDRLSPGKCTLHGRWRSTAKQCQHWMETRTCKTVHLGNTCPSDLVFTFR